MTRLATILLTLATLVPLTSAQPAPESSLAHLRAGEAFLNLGDSQSAAIEFSQAVKGDHQPPWTLVWSLIDLGRTFDATGQRDRAVKQYQLALETKDNTFGALGFANRYLWSAPSPGDGAPSLTFLDNFIGPAIMSRVEPEYSAEALLARLEGRVMIAVSVEPDGTIASLQLLKPLGLGLDEAALQAVQHWKFAAATDHGQPAPGVVPVTLQFRVPPPAPGWHATKIQFENPDGSPRPVLTHASPFAPIRMNADLAEEATIDAAMSRKPEAAVSMEIDASGKPANVHFTAASLPMWGEDAVRQIKEWRFTPGLAAVPCSVELAWFPQ
jgi:TonB family protein